MKKKVGVHQYCNRRYMVNCTEPLNLQVHVYMQWD